MTLILSEKQMGELLSMREVVGAVEECFAKEAAGAAVNAPRRKTKVPGSMLSVMHASLPYLGRAGVKCYVSSRAGTKFILVLFSLDDGRPLMVAAADILGRFRTGAASAVATKYLHRGRSFGFALAGTGNQALTQVLAMKEVASLESVKVWSPHRGHALALVERLSESGVEASAAPDVRAAFGGSQVASTITSSEEPFIDSRAVRGISHINLCGSNSPDRSECTPEAVAHFKTVVVDGLQVSKEESGDLIMAQKAGRFSWAHALELKDLVGGNSRPKSPSLFKSNGVAIEDVAVASMVYDKARKRGDYSRFEVETTG